ncbi:uncharacterized protein LOC135487507 [Lineus longissimus]|uniref:uncharacterized protein LOC135487507 n=1 Tax=Lineus longissimus TaxID=88925 RepID=UPI002B4D7B7C
MDLLKVLIHLLMSTMAFCYPTTLKKKCIHHMLERRSVDLLGTEMRMASVNYLELKKGIRSLEECVDLCCSNPRCDVALYNNDNRGNGLIGSCSLMRCHPLKNCAWRETVTVTGAMIFRGNKMPQWPHSRQVVGPNVKKIAQRLKRDSGSKVTQLVVLGDTDSDQTQKKVTKGTPNQPQVQPRQEQKQPEPSQQPNSNQKLVRTSPKPSNAPTEVQTPKENSRPTLPKDAKTNQSVVTPDHENPVPKVKTPGNDTPTAPNKKNMTAQEAKEGEKANLTAVGQIYSVVDKLKDAKTKSAALPQGATEASPSVKQNEAPKSPGSSKSNETAQASGQDTNKASTPPPPPKASGDNTTVAPSNKETQPPSKGVNDNKTEPSADGDEPLVVNPVYASMKPMTDSVSPKLTSPSGENKSGTDDSASSTLLRRTTRALNTDEGEVSNVTAPAGSDDKQTTVPADASEIQNILGQLDHEDKKGGASVHVHTIAPNATQAPASNETSKNVTVQLIASNATQIPSSNATATANVTVQLLAANTTQNPASNATAASNETVTVTGTAPAPNGTEKALNRTRPEVGEKDSTTTEQRPQNATNSITTAPQPNVSSSVVPETTLQNTTPLPVTTTISSELSSLLDKLLGTSSPPVETKTSKTEVMVTADSKKTTISITNQNTTPVETPKPGNVSEVQADTNHSGVTANGSLVAALSFGCIFFFGVVLLIGKRCYDGYQRRHYSKVDYLVNGMYN